MAVKTFNKRFVDFADWVSAATGLMTGGAAPFFRDLYEESEAHSPYHSQARRMTMSHFKGMKRRPTLCSDVPDRRNAGSSTGLRRP